MEQDEIEGFEMPESGMQKFRRLNPRIDYFPTEEAVRAIARLRLSRPNECTRLLIDRLVCAGIKTFFPENKKKTSEKKVSG